MKIAAHIIQEEGKLYMSRSYRKTPVITDQSENHTYARWAKRQASKKVRKYKTLLGNGSGYRKVYDPWNICDRKSKLWKARRSKYFNYDVREYYEK